MARHLTAAALLALTQTACLQSVLTPAHKLDAGELVAAGALETSLSPRLSASATLGLGAGDATAYGSLGAFNGDVSSGTLVGGGLAGRLYTPIDWALAGSVEYARGVGDPLADGETFQFAQVMLKFVSIPDEATWFYGGPTVNVPLTAFDGTLLTEERLAFFGLLGGVDAPLADGFHLQFELMFRPLVFLTGPEGTRFGLLTEDIEGADAWAALVTGGQLNVGVNVRVASF
jgi:hypothetical protein